MSHERKKERKAKIGEDREGGKELGVKRKGGMNRNHLKQNDIT